jgi:hypothetical protein
MISNVRKGPLIPTKYKKWLTLVGSSLFYLTCGSLDVSGIYAPYLISFLRINLAQNLVYSDAGWVDASDSVVFSLTMFFGGIFFTRFRIDSRIINFIGCIIFW